MESIYLIGAEDVRAASNNIAQAASDIRRAASEIHDAMRLYREGVQESNVVMSELIEAMKKSKE